MAVGVIMEFDGATLGQYDEVVERMGLRSGGPGPAGALFHWASETPGGLRVIDVWESQEQFEAFASDQIGPITQAVGIEGPPRVEVVPVHSYFTAG